MSARTNIIFYKIVSLVSFLNETFFIKNVFLNSWGLSLSPTHTHATMNTLHLDVDELEELATDLSQTFQTNMQAIKGYYSLLEHPSNWIFYKFFEREWVEEVGTMHEIQRRWQRHIHGRYELVRFQRWEGIQLTKAQAVVRGMLTRRVVHSAMCSPDADALPRAIDYCQRADIECPPFPKIV